MSESMKGLLFMLSFLLILGWVGDIVGKSWVTNIAMLLGVGVIIALVNTGDKAATAKGQAPIFFGKTNP